MITPEESGLPQATIDSILRTFQRHRAVESATLYGSRAMGTYRPSSDIDITLTGKLNHRDLLLIETELDELMLPFKIDLSLFQQIDNPLLADHIQRAGKVLFERE